MQRSRVTPPRDPGERCHVPCHGCVTCCPSRYPRATQNALINWAVVKNTDTPSANATGASDPRGAATPDPVRTEPEPHRRRLHAGRLPGVRLLVFALLLVLAFTIPSPFLIERPGPVLNTLGEVEVDESSQPIISISGAEHYDTVGTLNLLTVSVQGSPEQRVTWPQLIEPLLSPSQTIVPLKLYYPEGVTGAEHEEMIAEEMVSSQDTAVAAALDHLDLDVPRTLTVAAVNPELPSGKVLRDGDRIVAVDGVTPKNLSELHALVDHGGGPVEVTVAREDNGSETLVTETVATVETEEGTRRMGVGIDIEYEFPVTVDFVVDDIGGPSAGMIFALAIVDELTPGDLTHGTIISGTGTISDDGTVGAIGGLVQKMWAAADAGTELFLMPSENCADMPSSIPGEMTVAVVDTLDGALGAIDSFAAGEDLPGPEVCAASGR